MRGAPENVATTVRGHESVSVAPLYGTPRAALRWALTTMRTGAQGMTATPFCGAAPGFGEAAWTLNPLLLAALGGSGVLLALSCRQAPGRQRATVGAGFVVLCAALVSPLCNLAVALFGARVAQHLAITLVAAPLIAPALLHLRALRGGGVIAPAACFACVLWIWHLPLPYAATFDPDAIAWWWMHATMLGAALWLWAAILAALPHRPEAAALGGLLSGLQMGALGALLTFAPRPLYAPHAPDVTLAWGLTPLEDQQLGGLLMWVPGGFLLALAVLGLLAASLRTRRPAIAAAAIAVALLAAPGAGFAQGNDSTTAGAALNAETRRSAPVGVLSTSSVTTGSSGTSGSTAPTPEGADRRTRVLGPVCRNLDASPVLLAECRAKSGM